MSSFTKASKVNQKVHRERHQPAAREHLGLLEKKKDYKFRADDYNRKQQVIKRLRNAALDRNPDEFYFHMINSEKREGVHFEKRKAITEDTVEQKKLMGNRTLSYVAMKRTTELRRVEKLQSELHLVDAASQFQTNHIRFEESEASGDSLGTALGLNNSSLTDFSLEQLMSKKRKRYEDLARRIDRMNKLTTVQQKMEISRARRNDRSAAPPKLVKEATTKTAAVYQWKYQRKR